MHLVHKAKDPDHARAALAAGGVAKLDADARRRAAATAAPGTPGAALSAPTAGTTAAALDAARASNTTPTPGHPGTRAESDAAVSTTPPDSFDWSVLDTIDLNDLRRVQLKDQDDPLNNNTARLVYQPLVAGLERAGRSRTAPRLPPAAQGWKYYVATQAIIFHRAHSAEPKSDGEMLELARRVASSAEGFLAEWRALTTDAADVRPRADDPPRADPPAAGGGGTAVAFDIARAGKKSAHYVNRGNKGKGWRAFSQGSVVPAEEAATTLTHLTPQVPSPPTADMADVPDASRAPHVPRGTFDLNRKVFDGELNRLRACVGTGTLHTTYERIQGAARHGGREYLFNVAHAVCAGAVCAGIAAELTHLRAMCIFKPDGSHRPLGLPECEVRFFLGCLAAQEKPGWSAFYTSPLPEVAEAQAREVELAADAEAEAHALAAQARDAVARAQLAEAHALGEEGLQSATAAREQVDTATEDAVRYASAAAAATAERESVAAPRNHPVNFAFTPGGAPCLSQLVDTWHEGAPQNHTVDDDLTNMYNETSLRAAFAGLRERQPHLVPVHRLIYGAPAPIWLERTTGPLRAASAYFNADEHDAVDNEIGAGGYGSGPPPTSGSAFLRACKGGHQGCPLATNLCILPYFLALCRTQARYPGVRIAGFADDTYLNAPPAELYDAYAHKRRACQGPAKPGEPPACELSSNLTKVHASSPRGAIADIPPSGGDVAWAHGFKCFGVYKGPDAWVQEQTEAELLKRLAPLDFIDKLTDDEKTVNATQIKKILITDCAALQGVYWAQAQRPALSAPGLGAALARIRVSWEALVGADASPETRRDLAWEQACSPTNMGGCGIYNAHALSGAAYAASVIKNWPLLQRVAPALHDVDFATTTLPSIAAARDAYETLRAERDRIAQVHAAYDGFEYHTIHGDKLPRFRPHSLTPAARLPAPARLFLPDDDDKVPTPPSQKALSSIVHHGRWLAHIDAMHEFDRTADDTNISHREATRFVSASQFGAGMWLEAAPDASLPNSRLKTAPYTAALQRRLGLYLSAAKAANDTLAAAGKTPDWLGDASCNLGEHSTRHHRRYQLRLARRPGRRCHRHRAAGRQAGGAQVQAVQRGARRRHRADRRLPVGHRLARGDKSPLEPLRQPARPRLRGRGPHGGLRRHGGRPAPHSPGLRPARRASRRPLQPQHRQGACAVLQGQLPRRAARQA